MRRTLVVLNSVLILVLVTLVTSRGSTSNTLRVAYIDVGQGDSIWLRASDGTDVLIDGGPVAAGPTVVAYLQHQGIDDIEVMVLSHAHADHMGGLIDVLQSTIPVDSVIINNQPYTSSVYQDFIAELQARGITPTPAVAGQDYIWGPLSVDVLNPQSTPTGDQNDDSVVLWIVHEDVEFLFTGDISSAVDESIVHDIYHSINVLKVAHHGSKYSSSPDFFKRTWLEVAVISVGTDNPYGHPAEETLDLLESIGARVLRTDLRGTVVIISDGKAYQVEGDAFVFLPLIARNADFAPTATLGPPIVNEILPDLAWVGQGDVKVHILGRNFQRDLQAFLTGPGPHIPGEQISVLPETLIICSFYVDDAEPGVWAVQVVNPGGQWGELPDAFTILGPGTPTSTSTATPTETPWPTATNTATATNTGTTFEAWQDWERIRGDHPD